MIIAKNPPKNRKVTAKTRKTRTCPANVRKTPRKAAKTRLVEWLLAALFVVLAAIDNVN